MMFPRRNEEMGMWSRRLGLCLLVSSACCFEPPELRVPAWVTPIYEDEDLQLNCYVVNEVPFSIEWTLSSKNQTLTIRDVQETDSAIYQCEASNKAGNSSHHQQIYVLSRKTAVAPRVVSTSPSNREAPVEIGMDATTISCTFYAGESDFVTFTLDMNWMKNETVLEDSDKFVFNESKTEQGQLFSLTIHNITTEDLGDYECLVGNEYGNDSRVIRVRLQQSDQPGEQLPTLNGFPIILTSTLSAAFIVLIIVVIVIVVTIRRHQQKSLDWQKPDTAGFEDPDRELEYDVFISYSSDDLAWVKGMLFWKLRDEKYAICVDFKDFQAGQTIQKNIMEAIYKSRKTLVVMSKNFLKSLWGNYELQQAHNKALLKQEDSLVLVKLDECQVPAVWLGKTFLDYANEDVRPHFWTRLFTAMGDPAGFKTDDDWINDDERDLEPQPLLNV
ncbi:hypothetical protein ScPMuIL_016953 [Solemya velum]